MRKLFTLLFFISFAGIKLFAQCPNAVKVQNIVLPNCGSSNGSFQVLVGNPTGNVEVSLNGGVTFYPGTSETSTDGGVTFTPTGTQGSSAGYINFSGLSPNIYHIVIRMAGTTDVCQSFPFILRANYDASATVNSTAASNCAANGSITISGASSTDSVSWLSNLTPSFVTLASLTSNTIPNLIPGLYYVILKSPNGNYCYSTDTVSVGNTGTACPVSVFCGNATSPNNLFPNGTFGAGGNADSTNAAINGPALPAGLTQYTYQPLGTLSPEDGFYAIANNTYAGSDVGSSPFSGSWYDGYDHTGDVNSEGHRDGYMLIVNASYDPDIVLQETITGLCPDKKYQFSAFIRDLDNNSGQIPANLTFLIDGIGRYTTGNITTGAGSAWQQIGFTFETSGTSTTVSIRNNQTGGAGNDWALDDVYLGSCVPTVALQPILATCLNPPTQATAIVTDASHLYDTYQWQINRNDGNGFVNDSLVVTVPPGGFDANNSYVASINLPNPINPLINTGWQYRIIVGSTASDILSTSCSYTSIQTLEIQNCDVILPVKLISVAAQLVNNVGVVHWQVANQLDVSHYELEKSTDGKTFTFVTSVTATASDATINYTAEDNNISDGITYYRIKILDNNGTYEYSNVVTLGLEGNTDAIKVFPNPASDHLFIWMPANTKIRNAIITDAEGRIVLESSNFNSGTNVSDVELNRLARGFYNIKVIDSQSHATNLSFIKQ